MSDNWIGSCLRMVPADDVNFRSALERASVRQLRAAARDLMRRPEGNKSRIVGIRRELRKRER